MVLDAQQRVRQDGPEEFHTLTLISLEELHEIRRIWLNEKHEFDDSLPQIYREVSGEEFPARSIEVNTLRGEDWALLQEVCGEDEAFFNLQVGLLGIEQTHRGMSRRAGIFEKLERRFRAGIYTTEREAVQDLTERDRRTSEAKEQAKGEVVPQLRPAHGQVGFLRKDLEGLGE
jgi:DNA sulfur modification protein DndC